MSYKLFIEEHEIFRTAVRKFAEKEILPYVDKWEEEADFDLELFRKLGSLGYFGIQYPPEYGGASADFLTVAVFAEEISRCGGGGIASSILVHATMATPPIYFLGTEEQKKKYLIPAIKGEKIGCLAITEPNAGSDVGNIQTTAE
ncbi:MAG: acyl-CoA dehydrogenase family protein, partial [bacterium]